MSGGSSDTELNELIVNPIGSPSGAIAVMTVTPVAKQPSVLRKSRQQKPRAASERPVSQVAQGRSMPDASRSGQFSEEVGRVVKESGSGQSWAGRAC